MKSSPTDNSQWQIKGNLLLPKDFVEANTDEARNELEETLVGSEAAEESEVTEVSADVEDSPPPPPPQPKPAQVTQPASAAIASPPKPIQQVKSSEEATPKYVYAVCAILGLGLFGMMFLNRLQVKDSKPLPNTVNPQPQLPTGKPGQPVPPAIDINAYEQARNTKFQDALAKARAAWGSCGKVCQARRDFYLEKANANLRAGVPIEVTLLRELNRQIGEQAKVLPYNAELGGFSTEELDQIGIARSLSGDALAILEALNWEWTRQMQEATGQPLPPRTTTTVDLTPLSSDMASLWQLAALARNGKPQQMMRDSLANQPPVAESKPTKPEKSEGEKPKPEKTVGLPK